MTQEQTAPSFHDIRKILDSLPHRYPFLLVDRVVSCVPNKSIHAYKCVSINEPFFQGHFPDRPVMPGVLIMEALAQAGGIMVVAGLPAGEAGNRLFLFTGMENVRFRRPVFPGDRLELHATLLRQKMRLWKIRGSALVDGAVAAEGELTAAVERKEEL
jgi:3-hydroxyacyl-[acyl-carrier-protein] dehydratase